MTIITGGETGSSVRTDLNNALKHKTHPTLAAMIEDTALTVGGTVRLEGRVLTGVGAATYRIVAAATGTADGDQFIDLTGITGQAQRITPYSSVPIYVCSVNGDNSNDGRDPDTALQTITRLSTLLSNDYTGAHIRLVYGSNWSESIDQPEAHHATIEGYGSGRLPVLDARELISSGDWSKTDGQTNVYQFNWTPSAAEKVAPSLWEDGVRLKRVASVADVDAEAGTFYASTTYSEGVEAAVYVHATGSGNPASNGREYKQAQRRGALRLGHNATVKNIKGIANQHNNGIIELGRFATVEGCVVENGTVHHLFTGSGVVRDTWAFKVDRYIDVFAGTSCIAFIGYNTANSADPMRWERCGYVSGSDSSAFGSGAGFYAHSQTGQVSFGTVEVVDCEGYELEGLVSGAAEAERLIIDGAVTYNCGRLIANSVATASLAGGVDVLRSEWVLDRSMEDVTYRGFWRPVTADERHIRISDSVAVLLDDARGIASNQPIRQSISGSAGSTVIERMAVLQELVTGSMQSHCAFAFGNSTGTLTAEVRNCLTQNFGGYLGSNNRSLHLLVKAGTTYTGANNVFMGMNGETERGEVVINDDTYANATAYLAAVQPGSEAGSVSVTAEQVAGSLFRREYFVGLDARTKDAVPRMQIKYPGTPLVDRWRQAVSWLDGK